MFICAIILMVLPKNFYRKGENIMIVFKKAIITRVRRRVVRGVENKLVVNFDVDGKRNSTLNYSLDMDLGRQQVLINTLLDFTNSKEFVDLTGKSFNIYMKDSYFAISDIEKSRVYVNSKNKVFTMEQATKILENL